MARVDELQRENAELKAKLVAERIGEAFNRSRFVAETLLVPAEMVRDRFGGAFSLDEGGRVVATDASGNRVLSRDRPGEIADFDEALATLIAAYPHRDSILKSHGGHGVHVRNGAAGKTISREAWNMLDPIAQREALMVQKMKLVD